MVRRTKRGRMNLSKKYIGRRVKMPLYRRTNASRANFGVTQNLFTFQRTLNLCAGAGVTPAGQITVLTDIFRLAQVGIPIGGVNWATLGVDFRLSDVPSSGEFTALFDQYKIKAIKLRIIPFANTTQTGSAAVAPNLAIQCHHIVDFDDSAAPAASRVGMDTLCQYQNYKSFSLSGMKPSGHTVIIRPHVALAAYNGAFAGYANKGNQWIDCDSNSVQHYGWKCIMELADAGAGAIFDFKIEATYMLQFKNVR